MAGVNDTGVEVCCSVVIMDGVENDDGLMMEVLDKTEVMWKNTVYPSVSDLKCPVMGVTRSEQPLS